MFFSNSTFIAILLTIILPNTLEAQRACFIFNVQNTTSSTVRCRLLPETHEQFKTLHHFSKSLLSTPPENIGTCSSPVLLESDGFIFGFHFEIATDLTKTCEYHCNISEAQLQGLPVVDSFGGPALLITLIVREDPYHNIDVFHTIN